MEFNWFQYCPKCKTEKLTSEFRKAVQPGERNIACKSCRILGSAKSTSKEGRAKYKGRYREKEQENALNYYYANKGKHREITNKYYENPINKARMNKISSVNSLLRKGSNSKSIILGCTALEARKILETRLGISLNWTEFTKDYKIGFIIPISNFNIIDLAEAYKAFNINNLQLIKRPAPLNKIKYHN